MSTTSPPQHGVTPVKHEASPRSREGRGFPARRTPLRMINGDGRMRVCIVGASGKLGRYMVEHALDRGYEVVAVCREQSVGKLAEFEGRIGIVPGATDDDDVIKRAVAG